MLAFEFSPSSVVLAMDEKDKYIKYNLLTTFQKVEYIQYIYYDDLCFHSALGTPTLKM